MNLEETCPNNLIEVLVILKANAPQQVIDDFTKADESGSYHFNMGKYMRNAWSLWAEHNEPAPNALVAFFWKHGVYHADDMSGIINQSLHRWLNDRPIDLRDQLKTYINHWRNVYFVDYLAKKLEAAYNNEELWRNYD